MNNVKEDIRYLIKLVRKDLMINRYHDLINQNPEKIQKIDRKIFEIEERIKEKKESLESLEKEVRHLKGLIDSENDKINKKRLEEKDIKTNEAYRAWEHELEFLSGKIEKHEEEMLETLEKIDGQKEELSEMEEKIKGERNELEAERERLLKEINESSEKLDIIEDEKVRILTHISENVRKQYERIHDAKDGLGVANLVGDVCQGCFSRIPPQKAHEVRKNDRILKCEVCGRILVYFDEDMEPNQ